MRWWYRYRYNLCPLVKDLIVVHKTLPPFLSKINKDVEPVRHGGVAIVMMHEHETM